MEIPAFKLGGTSISPMRDGGRNTIGLWHIFKKGLDDPWMIAALARNLTALHTSQHTATPEAESHAIAVQVELHPHLTALQTSDAGCNA